MGFVNLLEIFYPVGSIYYSTKDISPASSIGGTWTAIKDKFLIGASDTYDSLSTGGEARHTLSTTEIPSHSHSTAMCWMGNGNSSVSGGRWVYRDSGTTTAQPTWYTGGAGGGQSHNNLPPYIAVYIWYRTA